MATKNTTPNAKNDTSTRQPTTTRTHTPAEAKSLAQALIYAQRLIDHVVKDAENTNHRYSYASADNIIAAARDALAEAGLVLVRKAAPYRPGEGGQPGLLGCVFELMHPASGEKMNYRVSMPVIENRGRPADKALAAAWTTTLAYALRDILLIPRIEGQEVIDARDDRDYEPARSPRPDRRVRHEEERVPFRPRVPEAGEVDWSVDDDARRAIAAKHRSTGAGDEQIAEQVSAWLDELGVEHGEPGVSRFSRTTPEQRRGYFESIGVAGGVAGGAGDASRSVRAKAA